MHFAFLYQKLFCCAREKPQVLFSSYFLSPPSISVLQLLLMRHFFFDQFISTFVWRWVFASKQWRNEQPAFLCALPHICHLWNGSMVPAVAAISHRGCEKDATEEAWCSSTYTFCNGQVRLNLETAGRAWLHCYPIFQNAGNRSCATWLIAHLMLAFAACSSHSSTAFGEEILRTTWDHFVLCIWNESECKVFAWKRPSSKSLCCLPWRHGPLELWFLFPTSLTASSLALFWSFGLIRNRSGMGRYYWK